MTLQDRVKNWLGIPDLFRSISGHAQRQQMQLDAIEKRLNIILHGQGRVIAKIDAKYAESEFSPERRAESDKLADEVIVRLEAEAKARAPYNE